jgi:hypothetical protein
MASGNSLLQLQPFGANPPGTLFATLGVTIGASSPAENFQRAAFDQSTAWYLDFGILRMPSNFAATTGITLKIKWGAAVAAGNVIWRAALLRVTTSVDLDTTAKTYSFTATSATAVPGTIGQTAETDLAITNANMDSVTTGDFFWLRFGRDAAAGGDTAAGDAYLYGIDVRET